MKRFIFSFSLLILACFGKEEILNYDVTINVKEDGMMEVTETIKVRAEGNQIKRGIYRDFPHKVKGRFGLNKTLPFEILSIRKDGNPENYTLESAPGGTRIRIGRADEMLSLGVYNYTIQYLTGGWMIAPDAETHELCWNVTGDEWAFPILASKCTVKFPTNAPVIHAEGYTGPRGAKGQNYQHETYRNEATFDLTRPLCKQEGWTIVAQIPAGVIHIPADTIPLKFLLFLGSGIVTLGWFIYAWISVGRDPEKGVIIPQFTTPENMSAAAVRYVLNTTYDNDCFTSGVVGAAQKGAVHINQEGNSYTLHNQVAPGQELLEDEQALIGKLLKGVDTLKLKNKNHKRISKARQAHKQQLERQYHGTLFHNNTRWWVVGFVLCILTVATGIYMFGAAISAFMTLWLSIWSIGCYALCSKWIKSFKAKQIAAAIPMLLFSLPFLIGWVVGAGVLITQSPPVLSITALSLAFFAILFYHLIKAPTVQGRKIMDHIEGLRHYLSVAEKDRLNMASSPPQTAEHFEKFLPYAIALGVGENWTNSFAETLQEAALEAGAKQYNPHFYTGDFTGSDTFAAGSALGGAFGAALASSSRAPSSSSSGGGGNSGSGGGGGGGGGW